MELLFMTRASSYLLIHFYRFHLFDFYFILLICRLFLCIFNQKIQILFIYKKYARRNFLGPKNLYFNKPFQYISWFRIWSQNQPLTPRFLARRTGNFDIYFVTTLNSQKLSLHPNANWSWPEKYDMSKLNKYSFSWHKEEQIFPKLLWSFELVFDQWYEKVSSQFLVFGQSQDTQLSRC